MPARCPTTMIMMSEIEVHLQAFSHRKDECSPDDSNRSSSSVGYSDEELLNDRLRSAFTLDDDDEVAVTGGSMFGRSSGGSSSSSSSNRTDRRGRTSQRRVTGGNNNVLLREKFEIESLYNQLSELKRQNGALRDVWERVRHTTNKKNDNN